MLNLTIKPLIRNEFARFGEVIEMDGAKTHSINEGTTERYHDLANVDIGDREGKALINIFRGQPRTQPIKIRMMERHPIGSQAFYPLQPHDYLVVVADKETDPGWVAIDLFSQAEHDKDALCTLITNDISSDIIFVILVSASINCCLDKLFIQKCFFS